MPSFWHIGNLAIVLVNIANPLGANTFYSVNFTLQCKYRGPLFLGPMLSHRRRRRRRRWIYQILVRKSSTIRERRSSFSNPLPYSSRLLSLLIPSCVPFSFRFFSLSTIIFSNVFACNYPTNVKETKVS